MVGERRREGPDGQAAQLAEPRLPAGVILGDDFVAVGRALEARECEQELADLAALLEALEDLRLARLAQKLVDLRAIQVHLRPEVVDGRIVLHPHLERSTAPVDLRSWRKGVKGFKEGFTWNGVTGQVERSNPCGVSSS